MDEYVRDLGFRVWGLGFRPPLQPSNLESASGTPKQTAILRERRAVFNSYSGLTDVGGRGFNGRSL